VNPALTAGIRLVKHDGRRHAEPRTLEAARHSSRRGRRPGSAGGAPHPDPPARGISSHAAPGAQTEES
jgi:hypothetical protein